MALAAVLASLVMIPATCLAQASRQEQRLSSTLPVEGRLPLLAGATGWLNTPPLTGDSLRGKVVLVDFWTYTCINWRRTLPYVRAWADKYRDRGLVVIGVHTPEFPFERNVEGIRNAAAEMSITYPIAVDSNYGVWRAFNNRYWPALYLVDAQGRIRYHFFGEGAYDESERAIRQLLAEAGQTGVEQEQAAIEPRAAELAADLDNLQSPETYLGYGQAENFVSAGATAGDRPHAYAIPSRLGPNHWALAGNWTIERGAALANGSNGRVAYRFHARDLHMVLAPAQGGPVRFRVTLDGVPPGADHGVDVDADGWGTITEPRLYELIRQRGAVADRTFEIEFSGPGARAYVFTFG